MPKPATAPIGVVLARTAKTAARAFDHALAAAGGSQPVWQILISLKTTPVANQRELADAVGIQGATLTHHLNGMEETGLVTRRRDPANRRVHLVELTDDGEQLFHRLATAAIAHDQRMRRGLTDTEIAQLADLLTRLAANVTDN
ncbi:MULTISPECIES: MarR family winged helix-turn-helix transcriptional regulator [unclassified Amycolatopsis]|uniref:MarR family winged helix-turn-helix transcriptional regulator n=1 Tax=unclassified Amycolatopsis TaxID=2618356 RepID=UPI0028746461|nr:MULTISPECIES: MarR family winged helix-turn-helix transcriptional regulator [unclassified Amycolatopsis]MDS0136728.1 winged helix-turn-helix transcriptional regulator [Amycolatopsis sp. 505]MDS0143393.1 winged helix-turn-helix transcriptional regulator [Amycolatopsis sp. CM201R]